MEPLHAFIVSREFEEKLPEKVAALKGYEAKEEIHFSYEMLASLRFRWEGKKTLGEIVLRETGDCDSEVVDMKSGALSPHRYKRCVSKEEFYEMFEEFVSTLSTNENA